MRLQFKHQKFQADAAKAVVDVFAGQPYLTPSYMMDRGSGYYQQSITDEEDFTGWSNHKIVPELSDGIILEHIQKIQRANQLAPSPKLEGHYNLTIEMETGVGKTYTYIKTMFELNKHYGWSKFIVVVPSIAIREGVYKSFEVTQEHFAEEYGKKIRFFIYNSAQLTEIDRFASDNSINVMIINSQAFNARGKDARRIYMKLDEFRSRRPIDIIAKTNPIMIIDEPQSVEGKQTKENLKQFNPMLTLRYSATHRSDSIYNMIYRLDAMEAYNKRLVKKIAVKGITESGSTATESYVYLEGINLSKAAPTATIQFDVKGASGVRKVTKTVNEGFNLYPNSGEMEEYRNNFIVKHIDGRDDSVEFVNGIKIYAGDVIGKVSEEQLRRIQIRETILSHIERERQLFHKGIEKNEDIIHKNYTILCSYPDSEITQYIDWNINEYFDVILQMSNGTINDDEEVVITVLNNQDLYTEYKKSYISVLQTTIDSIKEVTDSTLWSSLLDSGIIKYSEQNIIDYYNVLKLDKSVIAFINKGKNTLNFSKGNYDDDIKKVLFSDVVKCDSINDSKYKQILTTLRCSYTSFSIENISFTKMNILIDAGIIEMTVDNLKFLRENYPEHKYLFIKKNIEKYIEIMSDELFSQEELLKILDWNISDEVKISLLKFSNESITVVNKNYSTPVCVYILDNNLEHSDLMSLFSSFEQWQDPVQDKIFDYAIDNIASIINNADDVSKRLLDELFCAEQLGKDAKINLLIALMPTANGNRIKEILVLLKLDSYIKIFDARTKPQFEISNESEKLLEAFRENGFIQDYMESSKNEGYYTITRVNSTKTLPQELL